jgi:hypothetical protein
MNSCRRYYLPQGRKPPLRVALEATVVKTLKHIATDRHQDTQDKHCKSGTKPDPGTGTHEQICLLAICHHPQSRRSSYFQSFKSHTSHIEYPALMS